MKIQSITTSNFLGARAVELHLSKPVALIAGKNGAGKSSIQEAVRMALTGYLVTSPNKPPRKFTKEKTAKATAASAARQTGLAEIFAIYPHMKAVRGIEFKDAA